MRGILVVGALGALLCSAGAGEIVFKPLCAGTNAVYGIRPARKLAGVVLARDAGELRRIWREDVAGTYRDESELPRVDWKNDFVIAVFLGARPSAGYGARVARVNLNDTCIEVTVEEEKPAPGAVAAQVITSPYCMVACRRANVVMEKILLLRLLDREGKALVESPAWAYRLMNAPHGAESAKEKK